MKFQLQDSSRPAWIQYSIATGGIAVITAILAPFQPHLNPITVALSLLLVILFIATFIGRNPALAASLIAVLSFNFFFLPPVGTWTIEDPQNWIAWAAFSITAVTAGELSAYARRRAAEAERGKAEIERLYSELQSAFTQASQAEALRQSEKLKSALLDAVTHDMRTPLTSIKAAVTSLLDDEKTGDPTFQLDAEGRQEFLEIINEETDRLNRFIDGMVELARLEANAMQLRRAWSGIDEIITIALERADPFLRNRNVMIESPQELPAVRVDAKALAEVVYTLLDNAAKYSEAGSSIKITAHQTNDEMIEIAVIDQGQGIPVELRERVFDKFFRATMEDKNKSAGSSLGLGLAIARGIIESHGGQIWVTDGENNRGTRVAFTVPIGDDEI